MAWLVDGQQRTTALCLLFGRKPYWWEDNHSWQDFEKSYDIMANVDPSHADIEFGLINPAREKDPRWVHLRGILRKEDDKELTQLAMETLQAMGRDPSKNINEFSVIHSKMTGLWNIRNQGDY